MQQNSECWNESIWHDKNVQRNLLDSLLLLLFMFHFSSPSSSSSYFRRRKFRIRIFNSISLSFSGYHLSVTRTLEQCLHRSKFRHSPSLDNMQPTEWMERKWANVKRNPFQRHQPIAQEHVPYWHHHKRRCAVQTVWFMPMHAKWRKRPASEMVLQMLR